MPIQGASDIPDIYADGVGHVEIIGGGANVRIIYFTWQNGEKVAANKLILPMSQVALGEISRMLNQAREVFAQQQNEQLPLEGNSRTH